MIREFALVDVYYLLLAARWTLALTGLAFLGGAMIGLLVALLRVVHVAALRALAIGYVYLVQGIPLLAQNALLHACEAETSMKLALRPELRAESSDAGGLAGIGGDLVPGLSAIPGVNAGVYRWRQLSSRSHTGVIGDPAAASSEKGERLLAVIASALATALLQERLWEEPISGRSRADLGPISGRSRGSGRAPSAAAAIGRTAIQSRWSCGVSLV